MIAISFIMLELLFASAWLLIRMAVWIKQKHIDWKREAVLLLMYVNLAVLIRFTFFPMSRLNGRVQPLLFDASNVFPLRVNLIPLAHLLWFDTKRDLRLNLIGNVAMFIPTGIVLPILYRQLDNFWKVLAAGAFLSLCIEILQLPFSVRASDVDDLILNTLGVVIGYAVYAVVKQLRSERA